MKKFLILIFIGVFVSNSVFAFGIGRGSKCPDTCKKGCIKIPGGPVHCKK